LGLVAQALPGQRAASLAALVVALVVTRGENRPRPCSRLVRRAIGAKTLCYPVSCRASQRHFTAVIPSDFQAQFGFKNIFLKCHSLLTPWEGGPYNSTHNWRWVADEVEKCL